MGGCVAPNCRNSSLKGFIMKVFPRDPQRRAQWAKNVGRKNWNPTNSSYLCEVHFAPEMWESKRCDNKRKLRLNAVPTLFMTENESLENSQVCQMEIGSEIIEESLLSALNKSLLPETGESLLQPSTILLSETSNSLLLDSSESLLSDPSEFLLPNSSEVINDFRNEQNQIIIIESSEISSSSADNMTCNSCETIRKEMKSKDEKAERLFRRQHFNLIHLRKSNGVLRHKLKLLQSKVNNDKYKKALSEMLTEDQVKALFTKTQQIKNWSNETIQRALLLKFACGVTGYEEVRRLGMPLPSLRTLGRKSLNSKIESDISEEND